MLWAVRSWMLTWRVQAPRAGPGRSPNGPNRFGVSSPHMQAQAARGRGRGRGRGTAVSAARGSGVAVARGRGSSSAPVARGRGDVSRSGGLGGRGVAARR